MRPPLSSNVACLFLFFLNTEQTFICLKTIVKNINAILYVFLLKTCFCFLAQYSIYTSLLKNNSELQSAVKSRPHLRFDKGETKTVSFNIQMFDFTVKRKLKTHVFISFNSVTAVSQKN